jgi:hypothetical protein
MSTRRDLISAHSVGRHLLFHGKSTDRSHDDDMASSLSVDVCPPPPNHPFPHTTHHSSILNHFYLQDGMNRFLWYVGSCLQNPYGITSQKTIYSFDNLLCTIHFKCTVRFTLQCSCTLWCVLSPTLSLSWSKYTIDYGTHKIDGTCYVEYNLPLWCLLQRTKLFQHYSNVDVRRQGDGLPNLMSQHSYHVVTSHQSWASSVLPTSQYLSL